MEKDRQHFHHRVMALGRGFRFEGEGENKKICPATGSELIAIAAGLLYCHEGFQHVFIAGGTTAGIQYPSEAELMKDYILEMFPNIPSECIRIECESIDTVDNITKSMAKKLIRRNISIPVLSVWQQLPRAKIYFKSVADIDARPISCQSVIWRHGTKEHKALLKKYLLSWGFCKELGKEALLFVFALFDRRGKGLRWIIKFLKMRQGVSLLERIRNFFKNCFTFKAKAPL